MTELNIYGTDGIFHMIVKASSVMGGRYAVLERGARDLNINNLLSGLEFPQSKYPGVFCLPPQSDTDGTKGTWETFEFRLLFLCSSYSTGDNQIKFADDLTNTSLHTVAQDWNDMKNCAMSFIHALRQVEATGFRLSQNRNYRIIRLSEIQNDRLSGVMLLFNAAIFNSCNYEDIDMNKLELEFSNHQNHFH